MNPQPALIYLALTVLIWGAVPLLDKAALRHGDPLTGTLVRGVAIGAASLIALFFGGQLRAAVAMPAGTLALFVTSGLLAGVIGVLTYFSALRSGLASQIVPLAAAYPLITAVLSVAVLGEQMTLTRAAGIVLIVAGTWLVK